MFTKERVFELWLVILIIVLVLGIFDAYGAESRVNVEEVGKWPAMMVGYDARGRIILMATRPQPIKNKINNVMLWVYPPTGKIMIYTYKWQGVFETWIYRMGYYVLLIPKVTV